MKFCIITSTPHGKKNGTYYAYGPYVREMHVWLHNVSRTEVVAPMSLKQQNPIDVNYPSNGVKVKAVPEIHFKSAGAILHALVVMPWILWRITWAMFRADHIHLRCPGNLGLLGCCVQILFPFKKKTAKYAGNWDPESKQPLSYRLQKWILTNRWLTYNMQALVYGEWPGSSKNIKPFFTATYTEAQKTPISPRKVQSPVRFVFAGTLSVGKRPDYAVSLVEILSGKGISAVLDVFGEGPMREVLEKQIASGNLHNKVTLHGNQPLERIKNAYAESHFVILPSKSEGWPKVIAEGMFWGAVPLATPVSCVPYMLGQGTRGLLLSLQAEQDARHLADLISDEHRYKEMAVQSISWSRRFTLNLFASEIKSLLHS